MRCGIRLAELAGTAEDNRAPGCKRRLWNCLDHGAIGLGGVTGPIVPRLGGGVGVGAPVPQERAKTPQCGGYAVRRCPSKLSRKSGTGFAGRDID